MLKLFWILWAMIRRQFWHQYRAPWIQCSHIFFKQWYSRTCILRTNRNVIAPALFCLVGRIPTCIFLKFRYSFLFPAIFFDKNNPKNTQWISSNYRCIFFFFSCHCISEINRDIISRVLTCILIYKLLFMKKATFNNKYVIIYMKILCVVILKNCFFLV